MHSFEFENHGYIAQWLERLTADQQVPGSNPGVPLVWCSSQPVPARSGALGAGGLLPADYGQAGVDWKGGSSPVGIEPLQKGLRGRISPFCTLSQNGYGDPSAKRRGAQH